MARSCVKDRRSGPTRPRLAAVAGIGEVSAGPAWSTEADQPRTRSRSVSDATAPELDAADAPALPGSWSAIAPRACPPGPTDDPRCRVDRAVATTLSADLGREDTAFPLAADPSDVRAAACGRTDRPP